MAFLGADTDQVRTHGERCTTAAGRLGELASSLTATVHGVRWAGPDADRFRAEFDGRIASSLCEAAEELRARAEELSGHADEQDETSGSDGGTGPGGILGDIGGGSVWENPGPWQRDDNGQLKPVPGDDRIPGVEDIDWTPRGPWMQNEDGSLKPVPGR